MLRVIPLGGLGEVGLNAMVFECRNELLLVDAGVMFPTPEMPGVEIVVPDFSYLRDASAPLQGLVLTHAHEDHIGAVPFLLRERSVPVYGTRLTLGLLERRLEELAIPADLREIHPGEPFRVGSAFEVEAIRVAHSLPDAVGFALHTPEGTVVHTGDFKIDETPIDARPTDLKRFAELGERGVLCLFSDSTNAEVPGETPSERIVAETFARLLPAAGGRVLVAMFASHLHRVSHLLALCERTGRRVVLAGRTMQRNVELAARLGTLRIPEGLLALPEDAERLLPHHVCILATGAQGEPRAALSQMLSPEAEQLRIRRGDTVILSGRPIPGNERPVSEMINALLGAGAHVIHGGREPGVHVSGHASREQQRRMLETVRPQHFVPIHGELRQLTAHSEIAQETGLAMDHVLLARDGDVLGFAKGRGEFWGKAPAGRLFESRISGGGVEMEALFERRRLSRTGVIAAALVLRRDDHRYLSDPILSGRGLTRDEEAVLATAAGDVRQILEALTPTVRGDDAFLREELVRAVRSVFRQRVGRRPTVVPLIVKL